MTSEKPLNLDSFDTDRPGASSQEPPAPRPDKPRDPIPLSLGSSGRSSQPRPDPSSLEQRVEDLRREERRLKQDIETLQASYTRMMRDQVLDAQQAMGRVIQESLAELEQRKQTLQRSIEQLEKRQERIKAEMRTTFAGTSQDLAVRVQGFKDYLVGSLQDLATAAEQLELSPGKAPRRDAEPIPVVEAPRNPQRPPQRTDARDLRMGESRANESRASEPRTNEPRNATPQFAQRSKPEETAQIRAILDRYRNTPDYYGPPWQLRRTFEPIHAERVSKWFFEQGGRGALRSMGSRLQNILVASATVSVLNEMYGDRVRVLVLANSPERLGEWRRGLQDCLGISRGDFGADQGVMLFEAPEPLAQRADRLVRQGDMPVILIDEAEEQISLSILEFPLWLAFAPDPTRPSFY